MNTHTPTSQIAPTIGIVGSGVIGTGWAIRALARGYDVVAWDPGANAESAFRANIARAWPAAEKLGLFAGADPERARWASSIEDLGPQVDWVQENAPENEEIKKTLLAAIDSAVRSDVIIASSSSGLLPSKLQADLTHPERFLIGHPFNPVYLLPLVEIVAGELTSAASVDEARRFYDDLVMHPLVVRKEIEGYLSDRLQEALWREALHIVNEGIATTEELDAAITYGPGLRWAGMGTNLTFHLAGGAGGMRHMLAQFGPALKLPWTKLVAPELTDELIEAMADGCEAQAAGRSTDELEALRDNYVLAVMESLRPFNLGAGEIWETRQRRISAQ